MISASWGNLYRRNTGRDCPSWFQREAFHDTAPMRRAVAFARSIADSKAIAANFNAIVDAYDDAGEDVLRCEVDHVDGTFNALRRNQWPHNAPR